MDIKSIEFIPSFLTFFQYFICFQNPLYLLKIATGLVIIAHRNQKVSKESAVMNVYFVIILSVSKLVRNCNNFGDFCDEAEETFVELSLRDDQSLESILDRRLRERRSVAPIYAKKEAGRKVTETLDSLFEESSYDKRFRPSFGGAPTEIKVNIFIRSMGPVDEGLQKFTFDCYFRQYW